MINVRNSSNLLSCISNTIRVFTNLIVYVLIAINISVYITLITLVLGLLLFLVFKHFFFCEAAGRRDPAEQSLPAQA